MQQGKYEKESLVPSGLILLLATWVQLKMIIRCTILLLCQRNIVYPQEQIKIVNVPCQGKLARVERALGSNQYLTSKRFVERGKTPRAILIIFAGCK